MEGGATAIKLAIDGELKFKDGAWKKTVAKIGLGAATGAAIAAFPASGLAAGGGLVTSTMVVSSVGAGATAFTSNIIDQGIDKYFNGEDVWDLKGYNYKKAGVSGVITAASFGVGSVIGNKLALGSERFLWTSFNKQSQLYGVLTASAIDLGRAAVEGLVDKYTEFEDVILPPIVVKTDKDTGDTEIDTASLEDALDAAKKAKPKRHFKRRNKENKE